MKHQILAKRYAKALFRFALDNKAEVQVLDDLSLIVSVFDENRELRLLMLNPLIAATKKQKIFSLIFGEKINQISLSFIDILIRKGRGNIVVSIAKQYQADYMEYKGLVAVQLTTAKPIHENQQKRILELVKELTNKKMVVEPLIDEQIIGGFKVRMGDYLLDASVTKTLARVREEFNKNLYTKRF